MANSVGGRLKKAWNAFRNKESTEDQYYRGSVFGGNYSTRPDRTRYARDTERSIISSIYTRIGIDATSYNLMHVKVDENKNYEKTVESELHYCLSTEANIDQGARAFMQDVVMSLCDEGSVAVVPIDVLKYEERDEFDVMSLRTGKIMEWYPKHVNVQLYNEETGMSENLILPKETTAIIENPFYSVMNEPNSTLRRLIYKLNLLDVLDNRNSSGKLDLIIQLPYVVKTKSRREQAESRRQEIEDQLVGSKYGIAYTDGTEKITQLNRPVENNLLVQIQSLTSMLYSQLGLSESILNGTADEKEMLNYFNRTIDPILSAIISEFERKFLSREARQRGETIMAFSKPFKLVEANAMAEIADKYTRNEILSSNEVRALIGFKPSRDPAADELRNKNLNKSKEDTSPDFSKINPDASGSVIDISTILNKK